MPPTPMNYNAGCSDYFVDHNTWSILVVSLLFRLRILAGCHPFSWELCLLRLGVCSALAAAPAPAAGPAWRPREAQVTRFQGAKCL